METPTAGLFGDTRPGNRPARRLRLRCLTAGRVRTVGMIVALRTRDPRSPSAEDQAFVVPINDLINHLQIGLIGPDRRCTLV
jgi:hypothetical protein